MSRTVQANLLDLVSRIDPRAGTGQEIRGTSSAVAVTGVDNDSGLIRVTAAGHGLYTGDLAYIAGVLGATEANNVASNPAWTVTRISTSQFRLQNSPVASAYSSAGTVVGAMVGTVDGQRFPRQRFVDIYNDARFVLFSVIRSVHGLEKAMEMCGTAIQSKFISWTQAGSESTASYPDGYAALDSMHTSGDVPMHMLDPEMSEVVRESLTAGFSNPDFIQSSGNIFFFEASTGFIHYGTLVSTSSLYRIRYLGLAPWVIFSDVVGGTVTETLRDNLLPYLLQAAELLARETGAIKTAEILSEAFTKGKAA